MTSLAQQEITPDPSLLPILAKTTPRMMRLIRATRDPSGQPVIILHPEDRPALSHLEILGYSPWPDWGQKANRCQKLQLAVLVLAELLGPDAARKYHVDFAMDVIDTLDQEGWVLSGVEVASWLTRYQEVA